MRSAGFRTRSNVTLAILFALVALACAASSARAEAWGEVHQFPISEAKPIIGSETSPVGVKFAAGNDGSYYYVLTEAAASRELVLERFHEGTMQAKATFKRPPEKEETGKVGTEGVNAMLAVDPNPNKETDRERVYVLLVYERREVNEKEEKEEEKSGKPVFPLDDEMPAAGSLYAFEYKSGALVSSKTENKKVVPQITREEIGGQGESPKEALLDPRGMAVEPATGDLVITGNQDEEKNEKVEAGAKKLCRAAAQFVTVKAAT